MADTILPFFPVPRTHETIHSLVSRYLFRAAGGGSQLRLLGIMGSSAHGILPPGSLHIAKVAPEGHPWHDDPTNIVRNHTLVPLFTSYFRHDQRSRVFGHVQAGTGNYVRALLGVLPRTGVKTDTYKFCRKCLLRDLQLGVPISYTYHQPTFVKVCSEHSEPLVYGCTECFRSPTALNRWRMAGTCHCSKAFMKWDELQTNSADFSKWKWISDQVFRLVDAPSSSDVFLSEILVQRIRGKFGFPLAALHQSVTAALLECFGASMLRELGAFESGKGEAMSWARKMLHRSAITEGRGAFLKSLMLSRLVCEDVRELFANTRDVAETRKRVAIGYTSLRSGFSGMNELQLRTAIDENPGNLTAAARSSGLYFQPFVGALIAHSIRVPMPDYFVRRHGPDKLNAIAACIASGESKKDIAVRFGVTANTLDRVQLDQPLLAELHRTAWIERQRIQHRKAFEDYKKAHPDAGRNVIALANVGSAQWLRYHDRDWLAKFFPVKRRGVLPGGAPKFDWPARDVELCQLATSLIADRLGSTSRPVRVNAGAIVNSLGILYQNLAKLPKLRTLLSEATESRECHLLRIIRWAVRELAISRIPLTSGYFGRLASLPSHVLQAHKHLIVAEAVKAGVSIGPNNLFSTVSAFEIKEP